MQTSSTTGVKILKSVSIPNPAPIIPKADKPAKKPATLAEILRTAKGGYSSRRWRG